ncbi:MAG: riboflavin synthase [Candidatus Zixiibacteriota bacterium]|nr:MAG: riboflavin synthase [candidate division Zixibacteria bacterium]
MFTGIVQDIGKVESAAKRGGNLILRIHSDKLSPQLQVGSSVSINGACQTVTEIHKNSIVVEAISETLEKTNLGDLKTGSNVNLELPLTPQSLLDGHLVQGHIDCTGKISKITPLSGSTIFAINYLDKFDRYLIIKGSVAVDGISLTVINTASGMFEIAIIPHTLKNTILADKKVGDVVNLEFDMIAKYIEKQTSPGKKELTMDFLKEHGFS